jgi:hypothetical protein
MWRQLFDRELNFALIWLFFALLAYSLIGFAIDISPVHVDTGSAIQDSATDTQAGVIETSQLPAGPAVPASQQGTSFD